MSIEESTTGIGEMGTADIRIFDEKIRIELFFIVFDSKAKILHEFV
jgi:hypothetical protein